MTVPVVPVAPVAPNVDPAQALRERINSALPDLALAELRAVALAVEVARINPTSDPTERALIEHFYASIAQYNAGRRYEGGGD